ncbi:HNH endonuclease [Rubellimicrobium mesophilum DSM 19309]|uniref:HNH endonuclease n=1 Tax=Rubellimicrobium mesophilum DSM 19309 TaxID=442562 RepID=A0A017HB58_9RHOB|nr:HNH endonuclease [Rubellimicrobium mesophilum]EYD71591.1 HNH endonuclease [Rubellimicrobium mesophilum DSM 19309]
MPMKPSRLCGCGRVIPGGETCGPCTAERKARAEQRRPNANARGYTSVWRKASARFLEEHPFCRHDGCRARATLVDHVRPHRGDPQLFWDKTNWQPLCTTHHSGAKQREERRNPLR